MNQHLSNRMRVKSKMGFCTITVCMRLQLYNESCVKFIYFFFIINNREADQSAVRRRMICKSFIMIYQLPYRVHHNHCQPTSETCYIFIFMKLPSSLRLSII